MKIHQIRVIDSPEMLHRRLLLLVLATNEAVPDQCAYYFPTFPNIYPRYSKSIPRCLLDDYLSNLHLKSNYISTENAIQNSEIRTYTHSR